MDEESSDLNVGQEAKKVIKIIVAIFEALDFTVEPQFKQELIGESVEYTFTIDAGENAQYLIGHHGTNLRSIEHLAHIAARQKGISIRFKIDINGYRDNVKRLFEKIASEAVDEAKRDKKAVVLRPMSPYERRLVHTFVAGINDVTTDSIGEERNRKVVIKPLGLTQC